jgi:hypothetical protein
MLGRVGRWVGGLLDWADVRLRWVELCWVGSVGSGQVGSGRSRDLVGELSQAALRMR